MDIFGFKKFKVMKTLIFTLLLICFTIQYFYAQNQTLQETKDWIKEKIEMYGFSNYRQQHQFVINYETCIMKIHKKQIIYVGEKMELNSNITIPISKLSKIYLQDNESNIWLYLRIKNRENLIKEKVIELGQDNDINEVILILDKNAINSNNMKQRLSTAFNHLIKLCGGSVLDDKF
jgi:hypothetical protein